jgi:hypothetical protein
MVIRSRLVGDILTVHNKVVGLTKEKYADESIHQSWSA